MKSTITQVLLFYKRSVYPFPCGPDIELLSCRIVNGAVCVQGRGCFDFVFWSAFLYVSFESIPCRVYNSFLCLLLL